jgi:RsiW-degrading membrane proteinase PrsW (M82 family)
VESSNLQAILSLSVSLVPVVVFLLVLIAIDSFKLVNFRSVLGAILYGSVAAFACLWLQSWILSLAEWDSTLFARYVAPAIEETAKAGLLIVLIRRRRVGFMVDAAIYGFAVGAGFAITENVYYFRYLTDLNLLVWIIRGFGTAVMHGGVTAIMGIISKQLSDQHSLGGRKRDGMAAALVFVPGVTVAYLLHSAYNHFFFSPLLSTLGILVVLPQLVWVVFRASERVTRRWLGVRFDTDAELLEIIQTGRVTESRIGDYFQSLRTRFSGEVVVDMLCMLRLHLELSIRAKGILLMREAGFRVPDEPEIEEKFRELKYLEKSIGKTGLLAASPMFNMSDRDIWQLSLLGKK